MSQHVILEKVTNSEREISKFFFSSTFDWIKMTKEAFFIILVNLALLRKLHLVLQKEQLFKISNEMMQELKISLKKILSSKSFTIEFMFFVVDSITSFISRDILSLFTLLNFISASRESSRLILSRAIKKSRSAEDEETKILSIKRSRSNDVCSCRSSFKNWLNEIEDEMIQYDYVSELYLTASMFYAFWSLCVEHLNHLLQHLRMFSINDKSEIMMILR
jgi:hypothetical protein